MAAPAAPALPWAVPQQEGTQGDEAPVQPFSPGLSVGDHIEVRWVLHYDEEPPVDKEQRDATDGKEDHEGDKEPKDGQKEDVPAKATRWWGATVTQIIPADGAEGRAQQAGQRYEILYEAYEAFKEESRIVTFTDEHTLEDVEQEGEEQVWRKAGDTWEPPEEEEEEEGGSEEGVDDEAEDGDERSYTAAEVQAMLDAVPKEEWEREDAEVAAAMNELPAYQQAVVASAYRDMLEGFKAFVQDQPEGGTVTADQVRDFFAQLSAKRQRTR